MIPKTQSLRRGIPPIALLAVLMAGCGGGEGRTSITGKVTLDGAVVPGGSIVVATADGKMHDTAIIGADGSFTLTNAPVGEVKVAVRPPEAPAQAAPPGAPPMPRPPGEAGPEELTAEQKKAILMLRKLPPTSRDVTQTQFKITIEKGATEITVPLKTG